MIRIPQSISPLADNPPTSGCAMIQDQRHPWDTPVGARGIARSL